MKTTARTTNLLTLCAGWLALAASPGGAQTVTIRSTGKVQLNVRNLYRDRDLIPIGVQPWGEIATVRLAPERRWYLTNTFSF